MLQFQGLAVALVVAPLISGPVVLVLMRPLFPLVLDMCGTEIRARFWTAYLSTVIVLVTSFAALLCALSTGDLVVLAHRTAVFALAAATGAVIVIGLGLWSSTPRPVTAETAVPVPPPLPRGTEA